jgi:hypothetical protein
MAQLTARQSTLIFGWFFPRPILYWNDVLRLGLTLDTLIGYGLNAPDLVIVQPDPAQWVQHAGAGLKHARFMLPWGANPFRHFGADLADVIGMGLSVTDMVRMDIDYAQLRENGMTERTEGMFKFDDVDWTILGKQQ